MAHHDRAPVAMHETFDHPYVRVNTLLDKPLYAAGEQLTGVVEVACSSNKVSLGEISLELLGTENLTSSNHAASHVFLRQHVLFQRNGLPPSNAVQGEAVGGYWPARKGRCRFSFAFSLPDSAPTSGIFGGNAELKYTLKVVAQAQYNRERSLVTRTIKANVVERWTDWHAAEFAEPAQDEASIRPGSSGTATFKAEVPRRLYWRPIEHGGIAEAGPRHDSIEVQLRVRNTTNKTLSGAHIAVCRRLKVLPPPGKNALVLHPAPLVTETVYEEPLSGRSYDFGPGDDRGLALCIDLPRSLATMRKTSLFEVQILLRLTLNMGILTKELAVELPIFAGHAESMPSCAHMTPFPGRSVAPHIRSPLPSPVLPFARFDNGGAYSPSLPTSLQSLPSPYEPQRALPLPYARPASGATTGCLDFDPVVPDLTPSHVLNPQHRLYSLPTLSRSTPSLPLPPPHASRPLPTPTPTPGSFRPRSATADRADVRMMGETAARCMSLEDREVVMANLAPVPNYSSMARAGPGGAEEVRRSMAIRRSSAPLELPEPEHEGHQLQRSHSASNLSGFRLNVTPPPLAPSSRFYTPPTVIPIYELDRQQVQALDTIGEAGESRAGTLVGVPRQLEAMVEAQELADALEKSLPKPPPPSSSSKPAPTSRRTSLPTAMEIFANPPLSPPPVVATREEKKARRASFQPLPDLPRTQIVTSPSEGLLALTARLSSRPTTPSLISSLPMPIINRQLQHVERSASSSSGLLIAKASERSLRAAFIAANPLPRERGRVAGWIEEASTSPIEVSAPPASYLAELPRRKEDVREAVEEGGVTGMTVLLQGRLREVLSDVRPEPVAREVEPIQTKKETPSSLESMMTAEAKGQATVSLTSKGEAKDESTRSMPKGKAKEVAIDEDDDPPPKYDARSARGGRGGVVTSVAAQWAGIAAREDEARVRSPKPTAVRPIARVEAKHPSAARPRPAQDICKSSPSPAPTSTHPPFTASSLALVSTSVQPVKVADILARTRKRFSAPVLLPSPKATTAEGRINHTLTKPATMAPPSVLRPTPRRPSNEPAPSEAARVNPPRKKRESEGFAALMAKYSQAASS